ncbi:hypothetical protein A3G63_03530 [Candidatus Kaiserbacteria bacterium RIFCSPLOWO2_12_FULL_52_8]|nr:MAG: hypothetical protein A3G63_03530 [Candidatus Kaiserbacteria bacterium RIFCSPLOWO2_12_FULL_52_8]
MIGAGPTATVTDCTAVVCPFPEHRSVYVVFAVRAAVCLLPVSAPPVVQLVLVVQLVAFVELHESVAGLPYATEVGETDSEAVGAGLGSEHKALVPPFVPGQVHVYALLPDAGLVLAAGEEQV